MYDEYDDEEGGSSRGRKLALGVGVLALAAVGWFVVKPKVTGDDNGSVSESSAPAETTATDGSGGSNPDGGTTAGTDGTDGTDAATTVSVPSSESVATAGETDAPTTTAPPTTVAPTPPAAAAYPTMPDGTPVPVVAIFGPDRVTLTGAVPTEEAKARLESLAIANARPGQGLIENLLTINPAVPLTVGVRIIETTSIRFPDGSADMSPEHKVEMDRVVAIMNALPNITALVIGHADQRGDEVANYTLSADRADSVVQYIASQGVAPDRLSSRAVGEADLLTLNNDAAALELNKRTELIFYGLLQ